MNIVTTDSRDVTSQTHLTSSAVNSATSSQLTTSSGNFFQDVHFGVDSHQTNAKKPTITSADPDNETVRKANALFSNFSFDDLRTEFVTLTGSRPGCIDLLTKVNSMQKRVSEIANQVTRSEDLRELQGFLKNLKDYAEIVLSKNEISATAAEIDQLISSIDRRVLVLELEKWKALPKREGAQNEANLETNTMMGQEILKAYDEKLPEVCLAFIGNFPECLRLLPHLKSLRIVNSELGDLPESIGLLSQLERLELSSCQVTKLPCSLGKLKNLKSLNLCGNDIKHVPAEISQLAALEFLSFQLNMKLSTLPSRLSFLTGLQQLIIAGTDINPESVRAIFQQQLTLYV